MIKKIILGVYVAASLIAIIVLATLQFGNPPQNHDPAFQKMNRAGLRIADFDRRRACNDMLRELETAGYNCTTTPKIRTAKGYLCTAFLVTSSAMSVDDHTFFASLEEDAAANVCTGRYAVTSRTES